jgi:hypothetical protein
MSKLTLILHFRKTNPHFQSLERRRSARSVRGRPPYRGSAVSTGAIVRHNAGRFADGRFRDPS